MAYTIEGNQVQRLADLDALNLPELFCTVNQFLAGDLPEFYFTPRTVRQ